MKDYVGRIVAGFVTPVLTGLTAAFAIWAADNLPGAPQIDAEGLAAVGSAAALSVGLVIYKWVDNLGDHEVAEANRDAYPPE